MVERILSKKESVNVNLNYVHDDKSPQSCGYCKVDSVKALKAYKIGFDSPDISAIDYEKLMYLGWRKCGTYYYKANLQKSCCQLHTIRLKAGEFKENKHQSKVLKRFSNYLKGELKEEDHSFHEKSFEEKSIMDSLTNLLKLISRLFNFAEVFTSTVLCSNDIDSLILNSIMYNKQKKCISSNFFNSMYHKLNKEKSIDVFNNFLSSLTKDDSPFSIKALSSKLKKALVLGIEDLKKIEFENLVIEYMGSKDAFEQLVTNLEINVELMFVNFTSKLFDFQESIKQMHTGQQQEMKIVIKEECKVKAKETPKSYKMFLDYPDKSSKYLETKYNLYKKYQISIHKDNPEKLSISRFNSSWNNDSFKSNSCCKVNYKDINDSKGFDELNLKILCNFGSFNLLHFVDEELIAVSIIDIMPHSLSSVYCYYEPDHKKLSLGIYTALKEIEFISVLNKYLSSPIDYYFMGFYVQSCQKMKYKAEYAPSQLLCPVSYNFTYLTRRVIELIEETKGAKLVENETDAIENEMKNSFGLSNEELNVLYRISKLMYNDAEYKTSEFIEKYIRKEYRDNIISSIKALFENIPKDFALKLKFIMG